MEGEYDLQRFRPLLHEVLQQHLAGSLKQEDFPYVNPPNDAGARLFQAAGGAHAGAGRPA